ncbi:hypothetical protein TARUN_5397 [Trichoderma arundinaceum]|uniref:Uncharacterized protein n=1 Tax=Trichoderma arundinaceum TaxID=490622 RepID=A0A395NLL3_TRIAR|nr:hypothetical protein TARUN_5397 [Trichoderma arundinaceum]
MKQPTVPKSPARRPLSRLLTGPGTTRYPRAAIGQLLGGPRIERPPPAGSRRVSPHAQIHVGAVQTEPAVVQEEQQSERRIQGSSSAVLEHLELIKVFLHGATAQYFLVDA